MRKFLLLSRRSVFALLASAAGLSIDRSAASEPRSITVHKDPDCGCCSGWAEHLSKAGFEVKTIDTKSLDEVKKRLRVPADLAACHTAEINGYVIEGHVPATALTRFLNDKPTAIGLAVPGMPIGSPGMEGGKPERYSVIQFDPKGRKVYMRFLGSRPL